MELIDQKAKQLESINSALDKIKETKEYAVYWFAQKSVELANTKLVELNIKLKELKEQLAKLDEEKEQLKQEERTLSLAIENDNVGRQIKDLEREIKGLESTKLSRQRKLEEYNKR